MNSQIKMIEENSKKPRQISRMSKSHLRDLNLEEARGWIIGRLLQIELRINRKIIEYFNPAEKHKFEKIMLNSSIINMGGKLKVLRNTGTVDNKTIDKIRRLVSIRNGFAHAEINQSKLLSLIRITKNQM